MCDIKIITFSYYDSSCLSKDNYASKSKFFTPQLCRFTGSRRFQSCHASMNLIDLHKKCM